MLYKPHSIACAAAFAVSLVPVAASALPCVNYKQTSSTGGDCPTCRIEVYDNPEIEKYMIEASNGWSAELDWDDDEGSSASGSGSWDNGSGSFGISIEENGNRLNMSMRLPQGTVQARFRCAD